MPGDAPGLKLEAFPLRVAVWETKHPGTNGRKEWSSYSCKLTRTYKNEKTGNWEETQSLGERDLLGAAALLTEIWRSIAIKEKKPADVAPPAEEHPF